VGAQQRSSDARNAGATRVADQIKTLTKFIYLLGGVAKGIEAVDEAARRNEASPAVLQQAQQNKNAVKTSLQNVRDGLDKLEIDFRNTPELQPYYIKLAGVAAGAADAEQQAAANQFDRAGRSLLNVINRLTDVLLAMR
jgi:GTP1/Obg family GTP-binding protein